MVPSASWNDESVLQPARQGHMKSNEYQEYERDPMLSLPIPSFHCMRLTGHHSFRTMLVPTNWIELVILHLSYFYLNIYYGITFRRTTNSRIKILLCMSYGSNWICLNFLFFLLYALANVLPNWHVKYIIVFFYIINRVRAATKLRWIMQMLV